MASKVVEEKEVDHDREETRMTLAEEVFLLGLYDREGYVSLWNDCISSGLRRCILVELGLRGRLELEKTGVRRRSLLNRPVICVNDAPTGDVLLDEALRHIKETHPPETVQIWIKYFIGPDWNVLKLKYQLFNVRARVGDTLVEKGVCTIKKQSCLLVLDMYTCPLADTAIKQKLQKRVQDALLSGWTGDPQRMDTRLLALIYLAYYSDVLEDAFAPLSEDDYEVALKRVRELVKLDFEAESMKTGANELMWAVVAAYFSP